MVTVRWCDLEFGLHLCRPMPSTSGQIFDCIIRGHNRTAHA